MSTLSGPYAYDQVAVLCWSCGHIVVGGPNGGQVPCPSCGAATPLRPRSTFLRAPQLSRPGPQPAQLRAQDGKPLRPPATIQYLWEGGAIPAHRAGEAQTVWSAARRRAAGNEPAAGEELVMLGRHLASIAEPTDPSRARALLESSLEAAPTGRHRAQMLGALTRGAVRRGDVASAERWCGHFDPAAPDLESDSEWRVSGAFVATAKGDHGAVLAAVGNRFDEVAIQDALDMQAAILRCNAIEKSGELRAAAKELNAMMERGGPNMRSSLEKAAGMYPTLRLCEKSLGVAINARDAVHGASAGLGKMAMGCMLMAIPLIPVAIGVAFGASAFLGDGIDLSNPRAEELMPIFMPIGMGLLFSLTFGTWGLRTLFGGVRERRTFRAGVRTTGRVLGARPTGVQINDIPEMEVELEVSLEGRPVRTKIRRVFHAGQVHALQPGAVLHLRVDPKNPKTAILDQ